MDLFKNGVGRPSNETLKKRRNVKGVMALFVIAIIGISGYYMYNTFSVKSIESGNKNTQTATAVAEIHATGNKYYYDIKESDSTYSFFDVYGTGKFTFNINYYKVATKKMYYKIFVTEINPDFSFEKGGEIDITKVYKKCTLLDGKSNGLSKPLKTEKVILNFKHVGGYQGTITSKIYGSLKECQADTTSKKKATYGKAVATINTAYLGDVVSYNERQFYDDLNVFTRGKARFIAASDVDGNGKVDTNDNMIFYCLISKKYGKYKCGDVNMDRGVDEDDANLILKYFVGSAKLNSTQLKLADINGDNKVDASDARIITRFLSGYKFVDIIDYTNGDNVVDVWDWSLISGLKSTGKSYNDIVNSLSAKQRDAADMNRDGKLDKLDAEILEKKLGSKNLTVPKSYAIE